LWKNFKPDRNPWHTFQKQNPKKTSLASWSDLSPFASIMKSRGEDDSAYHWLQSCPNGGDREETWV